MNVGNLPAAEGATRSSLPRPQTNVIGVIKNEGVLLSARSAGYEFNPYFQKESPFQKMLIQLDCVVQTSRAEIFRTFFSISKVLLPSK